MTLNAREVPKGGKAADPMDEGSYPARLVRVYDMGIQEQTYMGEAKPPKQEIGTTYEFLDEYLKDEEGNDDETKPRWLSEQFALNHLDSEKAKSTIRYNALDPEGVHGGDWTKLLGTPVIVTIAKQQDKKNKAVVRNKITNVSPMRPKDAAKAKDAVGDLIYFSLDSDDVATFVKFPDWIKKRIKESLEFEGTPFAKALEADGGASEEKTTKDKPEAKRPVAPPQKDEDDDDSNW